MIEIVEPGFEILTSLEGAEQHIERCGRTCYRSEDKITDTSAEKFVRNICRNRHESVLEHASATVVITCSRACSHQLVRHRIAAYCLAGDTEVIAFGKKGRHPKRWTLKQLYDWSLDPKRKGRLKLIRLRSMDSDGVLVPGQIKSIIKSGRQQVYRITTAFGRVIRATAKHRFHTPQGWRRVAKLASGDKVTCNGMPAYKNREWLEENYIVRNLTRKQTAALCGVSEATLYKSLRTFGLTKPPSQRPNRTPGRGCKGMHTPQGLAKLRDIHLGSSNPQWKGDAVSEGGGYQRCWKGYTLPDTCECCENSAEHRHHRDKNPRNNSPENIMFLCSGCHAQCHRGAGVLSVYSDTIVSIEPDGVTETFDIEMNAPNHNFSANGFIVHNSQESMRYCDYGKLGLQVICPPSVGIEPGQYMAEDATPGLSIWKRRKAGWEYQSMSSRDRHWIWQMDASYSEYLAEMKEGIPAGDARFVLPNATKTEVTTTFNMRMWRHYFKTRCSKHAQWEIRGIAKGLLAEFTKRLPCVFEDLKL